MQSIARPPNTEIKVKKTLLTLALASTALVFPLTSAAQPLITIPYFTMEEPLDPPTGFGNTKRVCIQIAQEGWLPCAPCVITKSYTHASFCFTTEEKQKWFIFTPQDGRAMRIRGLVLGGRGPWNEDDPWPPEGWEFDASAEDSLLPTFLQSIAETQP